MIEYVTFKPSYFEGFNKSVLSFLDVLEIDIKNMRNSIDKVFKDHKDLILNKFDKKIKNLKNDK